MMLSRIEPGPAHSDFVAFGRRKRKHFQKMVVGEPDEGSQYGLDGEAILGRPRLNDLLPGLRKARGIHEPSLGERRVPYGRDHERHFPDRGRAFHFDWNALKGARALGSAQPMRRSSSP